MSKKCEPCFALTGEKCTILIERDNACKMGAGWACPFYKTKEQAEESARLAEMRCKLRKIPCGKDYAKSANR